MYCFGLASKTFTVLATFVLCLLFEHCCNVASCLLTVQAQWKHLARCWWSCNPHRLWFHFVHLTRQESRLWDVGLQADSRVCRGH